MFALRGAAVALVVLFVGLAAAKKGEECPSGLRGKCCGTVVEYTCEAPSWYTNPDAVGVEMQAYKNEDVSGECCCCTGEGGTKFVEGDIQAYNDQSNPVFDILEPQPPSTTPIDIQQNSAVSNGAKPGWCQQETGQITPGAFDCLANPATCASNSYVQNVFWCAEAWRRPPIGAGGDPHMKGFQGTEFDFNGIAGFPFSLVSEPHTAINALLDDFEMPDSATFIRAIGFVHSPSKANVTVTSPFSSCKKGVNTTDIPLDVTVNGVSVSLSADMVVAVHDGTVHTLQGAHQSTPSRDDTSVLISQITIENGAQTVRFETSTWRVDVKRIAAACHLDLSATLLGEISPENCGGLLCESLGWPRGSPQNLQGDELDYMLQSLTSTDFKFSRFDATGEAMEMRSRGSARSLLYKVDKVGGGLTAEFKRSGAD